VFDVDEEEVHTMRRILGVVAPVAVAAVALAGCGSSSSTTTKSATKSVTVSTSGAHAVSLSAECCGRLKFDTTTLSAKAGTVTILMKNPPGPVSVKHGIAVEGNGVDKDGKIVGPGGSSVLAVQLKAGKYTFYCPVPGHRQAGMQGTLTVT
jgi:plastocyanin